MSYNWQGASGCWYEFEVVSAARAWEDVGGVYLFVKPHNKADREWGGPICLFLAGTDSFEQALSGNTLWRSAQHLGAQEVHLLRVSEPRQREQIIRDLLEAQVPILNRQQRRAA